MPHFNLVKTDEILNGPVDYSTPVGSTETYVCSSTVKDHIERRKPVAKKFTANMGHDKFWLDKFCIHADASPDFVQYAKGESGIWYVQAIYL